MVHEPASRKAEDPELAAALAAVIEHARDDAAKRVLADLLLERGDERGEFLLIQFLIASHHASNALKRRADELWRLHRKEWMSGAEKVLHHVRLEGGFPAEASLLARSREDLDEALRSPMMATLHTLHASYSADGVNDDVVHVACSPRMRNLRVLHLGSFHDVHAIARRTQSTSLEALVVSQPAVLSLRDCELLASAPAFASLRRLVVAPPAGALFSGRGRSIASLLERLAAHPRLESVTLSTHWASVQRCFEDLRKVWPQLPFKHLEVACSLELRREPEGTFVGLQNLEVEQLLELRRLVPKDTVRATLAPRGRTWDEREQLVKTWAPIPLSIVP